MYFFYIFCNKLLPIGFGILFFFPLLATSQINDSSISEISNTSLTASEADKDWISLPQFNYTGHPMNDAVAYKIAGETYWRKYVETGLNFCNQYPNDDRRYIWLKIVLENFPKCWLDIEDGAYQSASSRFYSSEIDWKTLTQYRGQIEKIKIEYLNNPDVPDIEKGRLYASILLSELLLSENAEYRGSKSKFIDTIKKLFEKAALSLNDNEYFGTLKRNIEVLFIGSDNYGMSLEDLNDFALYFKASPSSHLRNWANKKLTLLKHRKEPFDLKINSSDGSNFDLTSLRGKIVLLDFWNIGCSYCIKRMPEIKNTYDKYKSKGFEVVSLCLDSEEEFDKANAIKSSIGASWKLVMMGGKNGEEKRNGLPSSRVFWDKYGFTSVPQLLLLDRKGKLVLLNGTLACGNFELFVDSLLNE